MLYQAVLSNIKGVGEVVRNVSPDTLVGIVINCRRKRTHLVFQVIVDGVCSVASEEIRMDDWGIDVVLTASQKGLGTPPGLSILVVSQRAIKVVGIFFCLVIYSNDTIGL